MDHGWMTDIILHLMHFSQQKIKKLKKKIKKNYIYIYTLDTFSNIVRRIIKNVGVGAT